MAKIAKITSEDNPVFKWYEHRPENKFNSKKKILMDVTDRILRLVHIIINGSR